MILYGVMEFFDSHSHYNDEKFDNDRDQVIKDTYKNMFAIPFEILDLFLDTINEDLNIVIDPSSSDSDIEGTFDGMSAAGVPTGANFTMINGDIEPAMSQAEAQEQNINHYNGGEELYMDFIPHNYKGSYYRNGYILKSNTDIIKEIAEEQTEAKTIELIDWAKDLEILGWSYY